MQWPHLVIAFLAVSIGTGSVHGQDYRMTSPTDPLTAPRLAVDPPAAPSGLSARKVSDIHIQLQWKDNAMNEDGFAVEAKTGGDPYREVERTAANVWEYSYFVFEAYRPLTTFSFRVKAVNSAGDSPYSNEAEINMGPPDEPTMIRAEAYSANQINVIWWTDTLVANKEGFVIERRGQNGEFAQIVRAAVKSIEPTTSEILFNCDGRCDLSGSNGVFTFLDTGLASKTVYFYRIRAFNRAGSSVPIESNAMTY
jgi:hypothetical protein